MKLSYSPIGTTASTSGNRACRRSFLADDAPGHGDGALGRLPLPKLVELGVDTFLRRLPHHARVEDRDVGAFERLLDIARREQLARDALGIGRVHLAPDGPDVERPRSDYRLSTSRRIPVRSSPSIDMSMNAGMHTRSRPPGAT